MLSLLILLACSDSTSHGTIGGNPVTTIKNTSPKPLDIAAATMQAEAYTKTLYGSQSLHGPICSPEEITPGMTSCSFSYNESPTVLKAGTIYCSQRGCQVDQEPVVIPATEMPVSQNGSGVNNDWLMWYLLFSHGGTSHHYHTWYDVTPAYGRSAYYTTNYKPSAQSTSYYSTSYSAPVKQTVSSTTTKVTSTASGITKTTTTKTTTSNNSSSYSSPSTTNSTRSTGFGKSTRSTGSGFKSSGTSRSGKR